MNKKLLVLLFIYSFFCNVMCQDCEAVIKGRTVTLKDWGSKGLSGGFIRGDSPVNLKLDIVVDESYDDPTLVMFIKSPTKELNDDITVDLKSNSIILYSKIKGIQKSSSSSLLPSYLGGCILPTFITSQATGLSHSKSFLMSTIGCLSSSFQISNAASDDCEINVSGTLNLKSVLFRELVEQMSNGKFFVSASTAIIRNENLNPVPIRIGTGPNLLIGPKCSGPHTFTNLEGICISSLVCSSNGGFTATKLCNQFPINVLCCSGGNVTVQFPTIKGPPCSSPHPSNSNGDGACITSDQCQSSGGIVADNLCNNYPGTVCCSGNNILVTNSIKGPSCDVVNPIDPTGRGACISVKTCSLARGNSILGICKGYESGTQCCSAPALEIENI